MAATLLAATLSVCAGAAGKPPLQNDDCDNWPRIRNGRISSDGRFALYDIGSWGAAAPAAVLRSLDGTAEKRYPGSIRGVFWDQKVVIQLPKNTLLVVEPESGAEEQISGVTAWKASERGGWLGFIRSTTLTLRGIGAADGRELGDVLDFQFNDQGTAVVYWQAVAGVVGSETCHWLDLLSGEDEVKWTGRGRQRATFDAQGLQYAYLTKSGALSGWEVWVCGQHKGPARRRAGPGAFGLASEAVISASRLEFSDSGQWLFFDLEPPPAPTPTPGAVKVNIWGYRDLALQSKQLADLNGNDPAEVHAPRCAVPTGEGSIVLLTGENESIERIRGDCVVIRKETGMREDWNWRPAVRPSWRVLSLLSGREIRISGEEGGIMLDPSPSGKWLLINDGAKQAHYSCNIATGAITSLGDGHLDWSMRDDTPQGKFYVPGASAWREDEAVVFVADRYDIWKLDLTGKNLPLNVTAGYGRRHKTILRLQDTIVGLKGSEFLKEQAIMQPQLAAGFLLYALEERTGRRGFFVLNDLAGREPEPLSLEACAFGSGITEDGRDSLPRVVRSSNASRFIVKRETTMESPAYFWTDDFRAFHSIGAVRQEAKFNWMTSEIVTWRTPNGDETQGVLYKPEDFDPRRRYPMIVYVYEKMSQNTNKFVTPEHSGEELSIAWLASNGYLVFCPDVRFRIGEPGKSALEYVLSGTQSLCTKSWVDERRLGIQGGSWGGFLVDYIITHTDLFAAAYSRAGLTDFVSNYGSGKGGGRSMSDFEIGQCRMGATLWQIPEKYLENSAVLLADRVTTPLLMMHNQLDAAVPFFQAMELFTALRRLQKKVWLLEYDGEAHSVNDAKARSDLDLRIQQFFDHYLKDVPPPKWMTMGIPARLKGVETGLERDESGQQP